MQIVLKYLVKMTQKDLCSFQVQQQADHKKVHSTIRAGLFH